MSWHDELRPITAAAAEAEPLADRLSFARREPSAATREALRRAEQPELLAQDVVKMKQKRRPKAA
jgi:hypothetical protein